jgi:hypothetical protein
LRLEVLRLEVLKVEVLRLEVLRLEVVESFLSYPLLLKGREGKGAEASAQRTNARMLLVVGSVLGHLFCKKLQTQLKGGLVSPYSSKSFLRF